MLSRTFSSNLLPYVHATPIRFGLPGFRHIGGLFVIALLVLTTLGCSTINSASANKHPPAITSAFSNGNSLEERASFQVLKVDPTKVEETSLNPSVFAIAEKTITSALVRKGFVENLEKPDFYVSYAINLKDKTDLYTVERPRYFYGHLTPSLQGHIESIHIFSYVEGTLIINLTDGETKDAIWQGKAVGAVPEKKANNAALLKTTINDILNTLPDKK